MAKLVSPLIVFAQWTTDGDWRRFLMPRWCAFLFSLLLVLLTLWVIVGLSLRRTKLGDGF